MLPISTVVLFSVLTLCSTLTGVVGATGPRPVCIEKHYVSGTEVCTKQRTPTCKLTKPATSTTCNGLAAESNISVAQFVQYNEGVDDNCDNLVIGNPYCVSIN